MHDHAKSIMPAESFHTVAFSLEKRRLRENISERRLWGDGCCLFPQGTSVGREEMASGLHGIPGRTSQKAY